MKENIPEYSLEDTRKGFVKITVFDDGDKEIDAGVFGGNYLDESIFPIKEFIPEIELRENPVILMLHHTERRVETLKDIKMSLSLIANYLLKDPADVVLGITHSDFAIIAQRYGFTSLSVDKMIEQEERNEIKESFLSSAKAKRGKKMGEIHLCYQDLLTFIINHASNQAIKTILPVLLEAGEIDQRAHDFISAEIDSLIASDS